MRNIFRAVQILANNNPTLKMGVVQIGASLAATGATEREKFRADADYWDRAEAAKTPAEHEALFMEALAKRLAVNGDEAGMGLIEAASNEMLKCFEERESHGWTEISYNCETGVTSDYTAENAAWHAARKALAGLLDSVIDGIPTGRKISADGLAEKVSRLVVGGYSLQGKAWMKYGKERIYVTVFDAEGNAQAETLYLEKGKAFWKFRPRATPEWADEVIAALEAAAAE